MTSNSISVDTLRGIPIFRKLNETECLQIGDIATVRAFAAGDVVLRQGETSQNLWIVLEGQCEVIKRVHPDVDDSESVKLAVIEPHGVFGEMSFFHPAPHSADVRAQTPVKLLCIAHRDYADLIAEGVSASYKLAYNVVESLADRLRRMDEWVAELLSDQSPAAQVPEWSAFRERLFSRWTM